MPEAFIVGGPNGAGKSTLGQHYAAESNWPFLGADAIAARLNPERPEAVAVQAGRQFLRALAAHVEQGEDFVVESTLAGRGPRRWLRQMHEAGYTVSIVFLFLDTPEMCIRRVEERVRKGGHHVPNEAVRRRYYRSQRNFWREYRLLADRWHLIYNGGNAEQEVAYGEGQHVAVSDHALLERFLKIIEDVP